MWPFKKRKEQELSEQSSPAQVCDHPTESLVYDEGTNQYFSFFFCEACGGLWFAGNWIPADVWNSREEIRKVNGGVGPGVVISDKGLLDNFFREVVAP